MASRPVFIPSNKINRLVEEISVDFLWHKGMAASQKKKNVLELHKNAADKGFAPLLEISTKSEVTIGQKLSAFNLRLKLNDGRFVFLESAFQAGKVFEKGGPYLDLLMADGRAAKRDERIGSSGKLVSFRFGEIEFPLIPKTAFYDWLYIRAIYPYRKSLQQLEGFAGFTDIEFNPSKSINCQARSCATFVALNRLNLLEECVNSPSRFMRILLPDSLEQPHSNSERQKNLFI